MSGFESTAIRECTVCGFRQTGGHCEDVLFCPECGACSWRTRGEVDV